MSSMIEVRIHGRGGQGAWTASNLLALAALREGKYVQSFPTFGPERMGAPIQAFTRISSEPINAHCMVYNPDIVAVLDPTLLGSSIAEGIKDNTIIVVNSEEKPKTIRNILKTSLGRIWTINATDLAIKILGRPITNTAILGAVIKASNIVSLNSLIEVVKERFSGVAGEKNAELIVKAYEEAVREVA